MPSRSSAGKDHGATPDAHLAHTAQAPPARAPIDRARELMPRLLAFEAQLEVLDHTIGEERFLLWPLARWRVFDDALGSALELPLPASPTLRFSPARDLRYLGNLLRRDPLRARGHFDQLIFGSTLGVSVQREGKWFGRINDYFALEYEARSLVLDQSHERSLREPRYPRHVAVHDALFARAAMPARNSRGMGRASARDAAAIERLLHLLREKLPEAPSRETMARLAKSLTAHAARSSRLRELYLRLFEQTAAKIVFLEDASFATQAFILKWARDAGVRTAEFQHGVIVPPVLAYNYAEPLRASAVYRPYLPEFLLTYGKFWSENTRTASGLAEIGNPHFELKRRELADRIRPTRAGRSIVFVSQADAAADLLPIARGLRSALPDADQIVYRLHPAEVAASPAYAQLRGLPNLRISDSGDIYELLHAADAVVGASSTALYEAAGLGRPVYVCATPSAEFYVPRSFGSWFGSCDELVAQLALPAPVALDADYYFQPDWRARFRRFMGELVGVD